MKQNLKLTSRGKYAVMTMIELAKGQDNKPLPLSTIAQKGDISLSYLEQLITGLRRHNLVKSYRGPGGGYILSRAPSQIVISEILVAAEDSTPAKKANAQQKNHKCSYTHELWDHIGKVLHTNLQRISLDDVLQGRIL